MVTEKNELAGTFPMTPQVDDVVRFLVLLHPGKSAEEILEYFAAEEREQVRPHVDAVFRARAEQSARHARVDAAEVEIGDRGAR